MQVLKHKGWANALSAGSAHSNTDFELFTISIDMTEQGFDHIDEIVDVVFQYADMLRRDGPSKVHYDEIASLQVSLTLHECLLSSNKTKRARVPSFACTTTFWL